MNADLRSLDLENLQIDKARLMAGWKGREREKEQGWERGGERTKFLALHGTYALAGRGSQEINSEQ